MKGVFMQVSTTIIISLGQILTGYTLTWPSYALQTLESDDSPIGYKINKNDESLIGSLPMVGSLVATLFSGWLADNIGRKRSAILSGLTFAIGWCILATAPNVPQILVGRFLTGFAAGAQIVVSMTFIAEMCETKLCGTLISSLVLMFNFGGLISYISGWLFSYKIVNYLNLTLAVLFVVLVTLLKETPPYLLSRGKEKEALESLKFYRGLSKSTEDFLIEFTYMKNQRNGTLENGTDEESIKLTEKEMLSQEHAKDAQLSPWKILCTSKPVQRAFVITTINIMALVFAGAVAIQAYAGLLFSKAAPGISQHMCSIVLSIAFAVGSVLSTVVSGLVGRRFLMIFSCVASSVFLLILASLLKWSWGSEWMIPASVLGYSCSYQLGMGCVPLMQMTESFVPKMKSLVAVIVISFTCVGNFIVLVFFGASIDYLGLDGTFLMLAILCDVAALAAYFTMRETRGVSSEEIQKMYEKGYLYKHDKTK